MIAQAFKSSFKALAVLSVCALTTLSASAAPTSFYPQPEPTAQEQHLLELINRARANPAAEGQMLAGISDPEILRYYSHYAVNTNKLRSDFSGYQAQPPLALNAKLMASSRGQSLDQAAHGFQGHDGSNGTHFDSRITAQGYQWHALGENVFAYVENAFFCHVGLNADWGVPSLDHRANIMNNDPSFPVYKEIGISCVPTSVPNFGPLVVTEDFGTPADANAAYVVGVIYNDLNGNGAYDEGEGLAGVTVTPDGGDFYTTTSASGGFVLPLPANGSGTLTVTASGGGLGAPRVKTISYTVGTNVKLDFTPADAAGEQAPTVGIKAINRTATVNGGTTGLVNITRTGNLDADLVVKLAVGGSAVSGVDYNALPSTVTIPAGESAVALTVAPVAQNFAGVKKVRLHVGAGNGYIAAAGQDTVKVKILQ